MFSLALKSLRVALPSRTGLGILDSTLARHLGAELRVSVEGLVEGLLLVSGPLNPKP